MRQMKGMVTVEGRTVMTTHSQLRQHRFRTVDHYAKAWRLGTGLPVALTPGQYRITGEDRMNGVVYYRLNDMYRVDSRELLKC